MAPKKIVNVKIERPVLIDGVRKEKGTILALDFDLGPTKDLLASGRAVITKEEPKVVAAPEKSGK